MIANRRYMLPRFGFLIIALVAAGQARGEGAPDMPRPEWPERVETPAPGPVASSIPKIKGLTFTGPPEPPLAADMFTSMADIGGNFVALVPEATVYRQSLEVAFDYEGQWYGEKTDATLQGIRLARQAKLQIMLKPHLNVAWDLSGWQPPETPPRDQASSDANDASLRAYLATQTDRTMGGGSWRGEFDVRLDEEWPVFAKQYEAFILFYARLAEAHGIELFCIGTELKQLALRRPDFFRSLIRAVRGVYRGALVYAANWDSYEHVSFWDDLDFMGIDAYFPISDARTPTVEAVERGWRDHVRRIDALHQRFGKPVILAEWGYEDEDFTGREPWVMGQPAGASGTANPDAQANAYEGGFRAVWDQPWMHGVFVWRWAFYAARHPLSYSPRAKPAADVLKRWFVSKP